MKALTDKQISLQVARILMNIPAPVREYIIDNIAPATVNRWAKLMLCCKGDEESRWLNGFDGLKSITNIIEPLMNGTEVLTGLELREFKEWKGLEL